MTGAGGPAAVCFLRAIAASTELEVDVWAADIDPCAAGLYLVPEDRRVLVPRGDDEGFAEVVIDLCRALAIDVIVPTVDAEMLPICRRRGELAAAGTVVIAPSVATLETCTDKWRLAELVEGRSWAPRSALIDRGLDLDGWTWPAVAKPRRGSGSTGVSIVATPADLDGVPDDGSFILQEHLPGPEHSLDVLARSDGHVVAVVPRLRLKVDSGIAVAGMSVQDPALEDLGAEVARVVGLTSVANVQVKGGSDGQPKLLEVNARFPGSMSLTVASGVDMPTLSLAEALGGVLPDRIGFRSLAAVRYWEDVFLEVPPSGPAPLTLESLR